MLLQIDRVPFAGKFRDFVQEADEIFLPHLPCEDVRTASSGVQATGLAISTLYTYLASYIIYVLYYSERTIICVPRYVYMFFIVISLLGFVRVFYSSRPPTAWLCRCEKTRPFA